jgi:hypothetical protein
MASGSVKLSAIPDMMLAKRKVSRRRLRPIRMNVYTILVQKDLASTGARTLLFWGPSVLLIALTSPLGRLLHTIGWTAGLLWLAAMCVWNGARCRRVHCYFTGPFFFAMAVVTLLVGFGVFSLGENTWGLLGNVILIGGIVLCCGPELIWGRYWRVAHPDATHDLPVAR